MRGRNGIFWVWRCGMLGRDRVLSKVLLAALELMRFGRGHYWALEGVKEFI